jgi:alpha-1,3-rhamnosyl/mannosyltransferase
LTSGVSALPEVAGNDAVLVDPEDEHAIAEGLRRLLGDGSLRRRLADAGRARAATFTWRAAAERTAHVLHGVAEGDRG